MRIKCGSEEVIINTVSNWPLTVDLFMKWGYPEDLIEEAKNKDTFIEVKDLNKITEELTVWGITWKR